MTDRDHRCNNAFGSVLASLLAARLAARPDVGSIGMVEAPILRVAGSD
jgi:hypothetical protein